MSFTTFCMCTTKERKNLSNLIFVRNVLDGDSSGSETNILYIPSIVRYYIYMFARFLLLSLVMIMVN